MFVLLCCSGACNDHGSPVRWSVLCWHWHRSWTEVPQRCWESGFLESTELHCCNQCPICTTTAWRHRQKSKFPFNIYLYVYQFHHILCTCVVSFAASAWFWVCVELCSTCYLIGIITHVRAVMRWTFYCYHWIAVTAANSICLIDYF